MTAVGFVVVEFNQAGGRRLAVPDDLMSRGDAEDVAENCREEARRSGRRDSFRLAEVVLVDEED